MTLGACDTGQPPDQGSGPRGSLTVSVAAAALSDDITGVTFSVLAVEDDCGGAAIARKSAPLERENLSASVGHEGGTLHAFADALFVLAPGHYRVCAEPLAGEALSARCAPVSSEVEVSAGQTNEITLVSQCQGRTSGGLDVVLELNEPPSIDALTLDPAKFITVCESVSIAAMASDPNLDPLSYGWEIAGGPAGGRLRATAEHAVFSGPAGDYELALAVSDTHGADTSLSFPVHVSDEVCGAPASVQSIFTANCAPCHITGSSGGLHIDTPTATYAALVGRPASAAACSTRVRVVPGDAGQSYLMAKLRGAPDICGVPMPRGRPMLSEADLQTIEAWINGLPH